MFKVVIVQPTGSCRGLLDGGLENFLDFTIVDTVGSVETGIEAIRKHRPDLVLLDIELPDGSGFEVFEATSDLKYEKIILSELTRYIFKAARFDVFDYLLKPLSPHVLHSCLQKLRSERGTFQIRRMYQQKILHELGIDYAVFRTPRTDRIISVRRLVRVDGTGLLPRVVLDNGESFDTTQSFGEISKMLQHSGMFALSGDHLLRLRQELRLQLTAHGAVAHLLDGAEVPVPPQKVDALRRQLDGLGPEPEPLFPLMDLPQLDRPGDLPRDYTR